MSHSHHEPHVEHGGEHGNNKKVAILISVLAALLAIVETAGKNAQTLYLSHQVEASNLWAFYQAKTIRRTAVLVQLDRLQLDRALNPEVAGQAADERQAAWRGDVDRWESEPETGEGRRELMARAQLGRDVFGRGMPEGLRVAHKAVFDVKLYDLLSAYGEHVAQKRKPKSCYMVGIRDNEGCILQGNVFRDTVKKGGVNIAADDSILAADTANEVQGVIAHEIGHALGLEHTTDIRSIMYLFREPGDGEKFFGAYRRKLKSADDIAGPSATGLASDDVVVLRKLYDD